MINFEYTSPSTIASALELHQKYSSAQFIAGGTNIIDLMKHNILSPERIINLNRLSLNTIEKKDSFVYIGALASNSEVAANELIKRDVPLLSQAIEAGASAQLRNMATTGGNIMQKTRCSYYYDSAMPCNKRKPGSGCSAIGGYNRMHAIFGTSEQCIAVHPSDMCVALTALDTSIHIQSAKTERTTKFSDFHRLPGSTPQLDNELKRGEMITGITIVPGNFGKKVHYLKLRDRASYSFALLSVAAALEIADNKIVDVRLAMGGVAHKPWRLTEVENELKNKPATQENFAAAAQLSVKNAKSFGHNEFKIRMTPSVISEALMLASKK